MSEHLKNAKNNKLKIFFGILLLAGTIAGGINHWSEATAKAPETKAAPQAMPVDVITLKAEPVRTWNEFSGRITAVDYVEVRPQVGGRITDVLFKEGALVNKGDSLFIIDERQFKAALAEAKASLGSAQSQAALAKVELERAKGLVHSEYVSKSLFDQRNNAYKVALAQVESAKAALTQAELNLEYSQVKAPISGRVSRAEITAGNVIQSGNSAPVLTTIVSNSEVYGEFEVDEKTYLQSIRSKDANGEMPVELKLSSGDAVIYTGKIQSFDNQLKTTSGTIRARAVFENKDGALVPGMFATIRLGSPSELNEIVLSERVIGTDQGKKFVYIVGKENKVEYREISLGTSIDGKRVIKSGLKEGDRVITSNMFMLRPDMPVTPTEAKDKNSDLAVTSKKIATKN